MLYSSSGGKTWDRRAVVEGVGPTPWGSLDGNAYLLRNEVLGTNGTDWFDRNYVTSTERQPYWTGFFVGQWDLSVFTAGMTVNDRGDRGVYADGTRLPPLEIRPDGTYSWRVTGGQPITGRWSANPNGPGVFLLAGDGGKDWLVYNNTDASVRQIIGRDRIRISDDPVRGGASTIGHRIE